MENQEELRMKEMRSRFKRVCVFCGSSPGKKPTYQLAAIQLGNELVERNIDLVYGGGSIGLMGHVSQAVFDGGRHVLGVIPKTLMPKEVLGTEQLCCLPFLNCISLKSGTQKSKPIGNEWIGLGFGSRIFVITGEPVGEVRAVSGMHQRKAEMARQADAFIALPGGYGTLEELLEVITWAQLGIHEKPVGLLNVDGYYNSLLCFIDKAVDEGFIDKAARHIIVSAPTAHELMYKLEEYVPKHSGVASRISWEREQQLGYSVTKLDIAR